MRSYVGIRRVDGCVSHVHINRGDGGVFRREYLDDTANGRTSIVREILSVAELIGLMPQGSKM